MEENPIWKTLWQQKIPPKYQHLIWRLLHNALPVTDNLQKKGIMCNPLCPRCNAKIEDINHVFKDCTWAQQVWFASPLNINFEKLRTSFIDWIHDSFSHNQSDTVELISSICYHIWKARNLLVFQQKDIPVLEILEQACANLREYKQLQQKDSTKARPKTRQSSNDLNWSPPPANTLKINVDAHFHSDGHWGLGWIVRKRDGSCLGAATRVVRARTPIEAEALGLIGVMQYIDNLQNQHQDMAIIVEMDAKMVVDAVKTKHYPRVYWGKIAQKGGEWLSNHPNVSVNWIGRVGNRVAHNLAKWALVEPNKNWLSNVPPQIALFIQNDIRPG
ncbi:unnamed protein product [Trifolium pratense]|uniref:Uncharacterized protein n=1 Tax=Trifolium pratense TaxID=57577 RepID=A0ACB0M465_TRIPR|nr:unnamed protein product [Trifolium pratense]